MFKFDAQGHLGEFSRNECMRWGCQKYITTRFFPMSVSCRSLSERSSPDKGEGYEMRTSRGNRADKRSGKDWVVTSSKLMISYFIQVVNSLLVRGCIIHA